MQLAKVSGHSAIVKSIASCTALVVGQLLKVLSERRLGKLVLCGVLSQHGL